MIEDRELIEKVARTVCTEVVREAGFCNTLEPEEDFQCIRSCVACRNVARAMLAVIEEHLRKDNSK